MKYRIMGSPYSSKERWLQMKEIYDKCTEAGIDHPVDVIEYFKDNEPEDEFPEYDLEDLSGFTAVTLHDDGFSIDLEEVDEYNSRNPEIHFIRVQLIA